MIWVKAGRRLVEAGYDWEKIVERMEEVLLAVAEQMIRTEQFVET